MAIDIQGCARGGSFGVTVRQLWLGIRSTTGTDIGTLDFSKPATIHVNAFHKPTDKLTFGAEYIVGTGIASTGAGSQGDRVQLAVRPNA